MASSSSTLASLESSGIAPQTRSAIARAFDERDALVRVLSLVWRSHLTRSAELEPRWPTDRQWSVCIHVPRSRGGSILTWRVHDSVLPNYAHLERLVGNHTDGSDAHRFTKLEAITRPQRHARP